MTIEERKRTANEFKKGVHKVLITTNVSSRGLDIPQVSLIVNYDLPITIHNKPDHDAYLHRIGRCFRTGRFGKPGLAVNLVDSGANMDIVNYFANYFDRPINELDAEDTDQLEGIEANSNLYY